MIVDANAFIGKWPYWPVRSSTADELLDSLHKVRVDVAAICSTRSVFVNCQDGNDETESATAQHPTSLIPFACLGTQELSHALSDKPYDFDQYTLRGFRGVRLFPQHHSYHPLFQKFVDDILEDAAMRQWPIVLPLRIIMNWGMPSLDPSVMNAVVIRHPKVNWILAGINYLHELQMATSLMMRYANVHLETSCVMGYAAIEKTVQLCGHEQILFGSGAPLQHAGAGLSKVLHANISDAAREAVLGKNFERLMGDLNQ
jgi:predicted TIM-barrel fold metal-dependent hydrolase